MTITVAYGNQKNRWGPNLTFNTDLNDVRDVVWDYTGELGTDTVSTATATTTDITAGTPSISSNVVTVAMSAGSEGVIAKLDLKIVTTGGDTISKSINLRVSDL